MNDQATIEFVRRLHDIPGCGTGGPLHIVTDDGNVDDDSLDFCQQAIDQLPGQDDHGGGWWREHQSDADTAEMVVVAREIIARLRLMPIEERAKHMDAW